MINDFIYVFRNIIDEYIYIYIYIYIYDINKYI